MKRDALGKFERQMAVNSSHEIVLGDYDGEAVRVYMDQHGDVWVQVGLGRERTTEHLLTLTLTAIQAAALLRKHAG